VVIEIALIEVKPGCRDSFVAAVDRNREAILAAAGAHSVDLLHCVEEPLRFVLQVEWDDIAAHDTFRESVAFDRWRADIGGQLAGPPAAAHYRPVAAQAAGRSQRG
jgi:quinol monooxygenase YgiN